MSVLGAVALGGALGAMARYGVSGWVHARLPETFPWGTLAVNLAGCFLIGLLHRAVQSAAVEPALRAFLAIGLLGAFTTFSTFGFETVTLLQDGQWARAAAYVAGSVGIGLMAVLAGMRAAAWLPTAGG